MTRFCTWNKDCDLYCYQDERGFYWTHIRQSRPTIPVPKNDAPQRDWEAWWNGFELINLEEAGQSYVDETKEAWEERVKYLASRGFRISTPNAQKD